MRATRGMFGAFGAGTMLAIASSVALLVVSSVVAFRGWPGAPHEPSLQNVARLTDSGRVAASHARGAASLALPAAPHAPARTSVRRATVHSHAATTHAVSTAAAASPAPTHASTATPPQQQPTAASHSVSQTGQRVADAVRSTTHAAAQAVAPVAPPAGRTLESLGAAGGDAVQQATDTAGKLVP